jgi:hypothetical protein
MYPKSRNVDKLLCDIKAFHLMTAFYNHTMAFQLLAEFIQYKVILFASCVILGTLEWRFIYGWRFTITRMCRYKNLVHKVYIDGVL